MYSEAVVRVQGRALTSSSGGKSDITFTAVALLAISRTEDKAGGENRGHNRLSLEAKTEVVKVSIRLFIRPLK